MRVLLQSMPVHSRCKMRLTSCTHITEVSAPSRSDTHRILQIYIAMTSFQQPGMRLEATTLGPNPRPYLFHPSAYVHDHRGTVELEHSFSVPAHDVELCVVDNVLLVLHRTSSRALLLDVRSTPPEHLEATTHPVDLTLALGSWVSP